MHGARNIFQGTPQLQQTSGGGGQQVCKGGNEKQIAQSPRWRGNGSRETRPCTAIGKSHARFSDRSRFRKAFWVVNHPRQESCPHCPPCRHGLSTAARMAQMSKRIWLWNILLKRFLTQAWKLKHMPSIQLSSLDKCESASLLGSPFTVPQNKKASVPLASFSPGLKWDPMLPLLPLSDSSDPKQCLFPNRGQTERSSLFHTLSIQQAGRQQTEW